MDFQIGDKVIINSTFIHDLEAEIVSEKVFDHGAGVYEYEVLTSNPFVQFVRESRLTLA